MARPIPEGMHALTPQLTLESAAEAIAFYVRAFGAEELHRAIDPSGKKVWHAALRVGDSTFFVNDPMPEMGSPAQPARLWLYSPDVDAAFKRAVDAGARAASPPTDMFWGDRVAQVTDRWNVSWMLATHQRDLTPQQMKEAQDAFIAKMSAGKR